ncbi:MAG: hypothetical protein JSR80_02835 [Verrucomicrobia bacterium]|nr:hypothetical protein [Verrucomicrobiota bacterium]
MNTIADYCREWCADPIRLKRTEQATPLLLLLTAVSTLQYVAPRFRFKNLNIGSKKIIVITVSVAALAKLTVEIGKPINPNKPIQIDPPPEKNPMSGTTAPKTVPVQIPKKTGNEKKVHLDPKVTELVNKHVTRVPNDQRSPREIALEVAYGNFKGARQTHAYKLLQIAFIKALLPSSSESEKKCFGIQMYEIDKHLEGTLDLQFGSDVWQGITDGKADLKMFQGRAELLESSLKCALQQEELRKNSIGLYHQRKQIGQFSLEGIQVELGRDAPLSSKESKKLQELLKNNLNSIGYEPGESKDDGDCFFDSVRQGLEGLGITTTVAKLRQIVSEAVNNGPSHLHYQRLYAAKADREGMSLEDYLKSVDICADKTTSPTWGALDIEGAIFAEYFEVKIVVHAQYSVEEVKRMELKSGLLTYEKGEDKEGTLMIAGYRNHFVPVFKQETLPDNDSREGDSDDEEEDFGEDTEEFISADN